MKKDVIKIPTGIPWVNLLCTAPYGTFRNESTFKIGVCMTVCPAAECPNDQAFIVLQEDNIYAECCHCGYKHVPSLLYHIGYALYKTYGGE